MAKPETRRIAILGAGPIGLEAAVAARSHGFAVTVYERGQVGDHLRRWGHVRMFSPFSWNSTPAGRAALGKAPLPADTALLTGAEHVASYLDPLAKSEALAGCIQVESTVLSIGRAGLVKSDLPGDPKRAASPFRLLVHHAKRERIDEAEIVLDCTGTFGRHRWLGEGGIPAPGERAAEPHVAWWLDDVLGARRGHYAGKSILLLGGGYSAATTASALATLAESAPETWVTWLARGPKSQPLPRVPNDPLKERDRLAVRANNLAARGDGNVEFHPNHHVQVIEARGEGGGVSFRVVARSGTKERTWEVERVIANVGYAPDPSISRELQVHECYATQGPMGLASALLKQSGADCTSIAPCGANALRTTEPNFFILGAKSYGRNSQFLLRTGFEQVRDVFTLITGK